MSCEACRASVRPESVPVLARVVIVPRPVVACTALAIPVTVCVVPPPPIGRGGGGRGRPPSCATPVMGHASRLATSMPAPVAVRRKESALRILPPWSEMRAVWIAGGDSNPRRRYPSSDWTMRQTRHGARHQGGAPAEVPRWKGAEGRPSTGVLFWLSRLSAARGGRGAQEVGGARGLVVDAGEVPRGRRVRLVELNVAAAAVAVVQLVGEVEELGRVDDDVDGGVPLWLCQPDVEL